MARIIFKCPYINSGTKTAKDCSSIVMYIAKREGAEKVREPNESMEKINAADAGGEDITKYLSYISKRPRAERKGEHALFSYDDEDISLKKVAEELSELQGRIWLPIISLKREDAEKFGFANAHSWKRLLINNMPEIAEGFKIPLEHFRWYAAFHNESYHPHIHMICYSDDDRFGYLTEQGIRKIKSVIANEIFKSELMPLYAEKTKIRERTKQEAERKLTECIDKMKQGKVESEKASLLILSLANDLKKTKGKKQYAFLSAPLKNLVDAIIDELGKDKNVAEAYMNWRIVKEKICSIYDDTEEEFQSLSKCKELYRIRSVVIKEAIELAEKQQMFHESGEVKNSNYESGQVKSSDDKNGDALISATKVMHHLSNIFQETAFHSGMTYMPDRKLLRKLRRKKIAEGHQSDEHHVNM